MTTLRTDVAVVGGGPAGCALALRLAVLGHQVVLLERDPQAHRDRIESLSPGVRVHLGTLGIAEPPGRLCERRIIRWKGETETVVSESLIVDRARFDAHLRTAAGRAGVQCLQATVHGAERCGDRWRLTAGHTTIDAAFLADATGRAGLLRRPRRPVSPPTFALRARWSADHTDAIDPDAMRIGVFPDGWAWGVRAENGSEHAAVFVDREQAPLRNEIVALLARAELFAFLAHPPDDVQVCDVTPYVVDEPIGTDFILAGDASCAIDPLSSSGVQAALGAALAASFAVHTIRVAGERTAAAIAFYQAHVQSASARHDRWRKEHYTSADARGSFWSSRSEATLPSTEPPLPSPDATVALHPGAALVEGPIVNGDLIETRRLLRTPSGEQVAFIGGLEVAPLFSAFRNGMSAAQLARSWDLEPRAAIGVMRCLIANGTVIPAEGS
ncbi:MAG: FAD-dependent oxidoreductase [Acidobacteriota bacterium]